jgi:hypothetical protein
MRLGDVRFAPTATDRGVQPNVAMCQKLLSPTSFDYFVCRYK